MRPAVVATARVKMVPAGGGVSTDGLFGLTFNPVRSVLHAVTASAATSATESRAFFIS